MRAVAILLILCAGCVTSTSRDNDDDSPSSGAMQSTGAVGPNVGAGGSSTTSVGGATASTSGAGGNLPQLDPPAGASSNGSGGPIVSGTVQQAGSITFRLIVPGNYSGAPTALLIVFSGTEGGANMTSNLLQLESYTNTGGFIRAVLDGVTYNGNGQAGATVLDAMRMQYNVDNDRTYLLGESAGTSAALELGFQLRQSYFAAYWANDVNATGSPSQTSAQLGFQPWGQVGPGGQFAIADQIVSGMQAAGYRLPNPAPYAGTGAGQHGSVDQFIAALSWFQGKTRL